MTPRASEKEVARELAERGATVLVHGRSRPRVDSAITEIAQATGSQSLVPLVADLASLAAVRALADDLVADGDHLDALVNNAGIGTVGTLEQGAAATMRLVIDPALDGVSGKSFVGLEEAAANPQAYDQEARVRLWELSERLCGLS